MRDRRPLPFPEARHLKRCQILSTDKASAHCFHAIAADFRTRRSSANRPTGRSVLQRTQVFPQATAWAWCTCQMGCRTQGCHIRRIKQPGGGGHPGHHLRAIWLHSAGDMAAFCGRHACIWSTALPLRRALKQDRTAICTVFFKMNNHMAA